MLEKITYKNVKRILFRELIIFSPSAKSGLFRAKAKIKFPVWWILILSLVMWYRKTKPFELGGPLEECVVVVADVAVAVNENDKLKTYQ